MRPAANTFLRLAFCLAFTVHAQPVPSDNPVQIAEEEAVRRQEATIEMRQLLAQAQDAQKRNHQVDAAKLYQAAVAKFPDVESGNSVVDMQKQEVVTGLDVVREKLAREALAGGNMAEATHQVDLALKVDPDNASLRHLKAEINQRAVEQLGRVPSPDMIQRIPAIEKQKIDIATRVQNAKLLYEMGKLDEAEAILVRVMADDPSNRSAPYYLDLIKEARYADRARAHEAAAKTRMVEVENAWVPPVKQNSLPVPNPMATTNLIYTTEGRQQILSKLERIRMNEVSFDLPLTEVLVRLRNESQKRDPDGQGINFMINPHADAIAGAISPTDTTGGAPAGLVTAPAPAVDMSTVTIKIAPPLTNLRLADVLDAITKVADQPIKYTVEDYAVVFSPKPAEAIALYTKVFKVDPNTFVQGLENVLAYSPPINGGTSGGGGGGGGGGGSTGGTVNNGPASIPYVQYAQPTTSGGGGGSTIQAGGRQLGLSFVTRTNSTLDLHEMVRAYFTAAGVSLTDPGKSVFFNDRTGLLMVHASSQDLEIIQEAIETLDQAPPQVSIEAKFAELSQEDTKALGFNWYLGNTLLNNGAIGLQAGTAPSYQGAGTTANPSGIFPGPGTLIPGTSTFIPGPGAVGSASTDNNLTSGLRNSYAAGGTLSGLTGVPTVGTITGIMTDPQFRVAINAIEQRTGSDVLAAPKITTLSGRQAHMATQDLQDIVTSVSITQTTSGTPSGGISTGLSALGAIASAITYTTQVFPIGAELDVMPTVSADGYSIQMVLVPSYLEFLQYDNPGSFVPSAQSVGGTTLGVPLTAVLPLPHFRLRQVVTTCNVWDGQTVVLGGLIAENIVKLSDKVPVLGDLPLVGRLFQSQSTDSLKDNLLIFVTPTIIDPAGNRVHTDDDLPFAQTTIPPQPVTGQ